MAMKIRFFQVFSMKKDKQYFWTITPVRTRTITFNNSKDVYPFKNVYILKVKGRINKGMWKGRGG